MAEGERPITPVRQCLGNWQLQKLEHLGSIHPPYRLVSIMEAIIDESIPFYAAQAAGKKSWAWDDSLLQQICSKTEPSRFQCQVKTKRGAILKVAGVEEAKVPPVADMELNIKGAWSEKEDMVVLHHVANFGGTQWNKIQVGTCSCFLKLSMGQIKFCRS